MTFSAVLPLSLHHPHPVNPRQLFERLVSFHPRQAHPPPLQLPALPPPPPLSLMTALLLQLLLLRLVSLVLVVQLLRPLVLPCEQVLLLLVLLRLPPVTSESLQLQLLRAAATPTIDPASADEDQAGDHCLSEAGPITPSCHDPLHESLPGKQPAKHWGC